MQCLPSGRAADSRGHPGPQGIHVSGSGLSAEAVARRRARATHSFALPRPGIGRCRCGSSWALSISCILVDGTVSYCGVCRDAFLRRGRQRGAKGASPSFYLNKLWTTNGLSHSSHQNRLSTRNEYPTPKIYVGALLLRPKPTWKSSCWVLVMR